MRTSAPFAVSEEQRALRSAVADALPLSAGVTLYVAASDLVPEVNREPGVGVALLVFLGVAVLLGLKVLFHAWSGQG